MKRNNKIEQRSIEWLELKWAKIGGTASNGLFIDSDTLFIDIMSQVIEDFEPEEVFSTKDMQRGIDLEPFAIEYLNGYTGLIFGDAGWLQSEENKLLGISPDGITTDNRVACEVKCFGRKNHLNILINNEIPKENIFQCIHYFTVNPKLEELYFLCFRPESKKHFIKKLTKDSMVDIGWTVKGKVNEDRGRGFKDYACTNPDIKTVSEWVAIAKESADKLLLRIDETVDKLNNEI